MKGFLRYTFTSPFSFLYAKKWKLLTSLANERQHLSRLARSPLFYPINATRVSGRTRVNRNGGCLTSEVHIHRTMMGDQAMAPCNGAGNEVH